jgi:hypothetical protein
MKRMTLVVENEELYRALKVEAVKHNRRLRDVIQEAMAMWLEAQEDAEDLAAHCEALAETGENVEAGRFFQSIADDAAALPS